MSKRKRNRAAATVEAKAEASGWQATAPVPQEPRGPLAYAVAAVLALVPCFWQSRIQAGDLASHIYNAWLAQLIQQGKAPGLSIVPLKTNVLFDLLLSAFFNAFGAAAAQRIAVPLVVLVFVSGAFAFCWRAAARQPWTMLPAIVALAYGWVFHMGFFNFYLSLGLCFWALAVGWELKPKMLALAAGLLALAFVAHGLAVAWAAAVLLWRWMARRWEPYRWQLFGLALAGIVAVRVILSATVQTAWSWEQIGFSVGVSELWVYGQPFALPAIGLGAIFVILIVTMVWKQGRGTVFATDLFQICALTAAGIFLIPNWASLPQYHHALVFISERMALAMAICLCALVSAAPLRAWHLYAAAAVAVLFFALLYPQESMINRFEDAEETLVAALPPGQRVLSGVEAPYVRVIPVTHLVDRVCIGRCYSYANYEPSSAQFRIRVTGPQKIVAPTDMDSSRLQVGAYTVRPEDLPLYQMDLDRQGNLRVRSLPPGVPNGLTLWYGLWP